MANVRITFRGFRCFLIVLSALLLSTSSLLGQTAGPPPVAPPSGNPLIPDPNLPLDVPPTPDRPLAAVPGQVSPEAVNAGDLNAAKPEETVVDVRIQGNRNVPLIKIASQVKTRAGRPFRLDVIQEDVRRLNRTKLFITVKTFTRRVPEGVVVVFDVVERPLLLYVKYVGVSAMSIKSLQKESGLKAGDPFDPFSVEEARRKLESYYHEKGYGQAMVTLLEGNRTEDRGAVFLIDEGLHQRILWTNFVGNTIASDARLRTQIESTPGYFWLIKGDVDRKKIDEDVQKLTAYYRSLGFFQAHVGRELHFNDRGNWLTLTFVIDEGLRHKIRNVTLIGNTKFTTADLSEKLKLKSGDYFDQAKLVHDQLIIQDKYGSKGYVYADIKPDTRILEDPGLLDLVYTITEGDRYRVGKIYVNIQGDPSRTKLTTVLNRMSLKPGDILDTRELRKSERRLQASGLFLADRAKGVIPKITYNSPDKGTEVANENGDAAPPKPPKFRGQSPELLPADLQAPNGDHVIDFTVKGTLVPDGQTPATAAPIQPAASPIQPAAWNTPVVSEQASVASYKAYRPETPVSMESAETQPLISREVWACLQDPQTTTTGTNTTPTYVASDAPTPATQSPNSALTLTDPRPVRQMVVRGQYTSEDNGYSLPPLPARDSYSSQPTSVQGASATSPVPASSYAAPSYSSPTSNYTTTNPPPANNNGSIAPSSSPGLISATNQPVTDDGRVFDPPGDDEFTRSLDLNTQLKDTETGKFSLGVGVNSDAGLMGTASIDERNFDIGKWPSSWQDIYNGQAFRGAGQQLRLEASPGTQLQRYSATFREPYLFNTDVSFGVSGYYYDRIYDEWQEQRVGGKVSLGYQLTHDLTITGSYRGERVNISNIINPYVPDYQQMLGTNALHGFGVSLTHDTRDNAFLPTEGHLIDLSFEQVIGTFQYPTVELNARKYFTLYQRPDGSGRHVLTFASRIGYKGANTPAYDRFFAGGYDTIRGFQFRDASPLDTIFNSYVVGGDAEVLASVEYMFPITADDMLRGVIFCDTGAIQPSFSNWKDTYRVAPGFGLRITMPALGPAPIALDFAFPISTQPGDHVQNFSFFIGVGR